MKLAVKLQKPDEPDHVCRAAVQCHLLDRCTYYRSDRAKAVLLLRVHCSVSLTFMFSFTTEFLKSE